MKTIRQEFIKRPSNLSGCDKTQVGRPISTNLAQKGTIINDLLILEAFAMAPLCPVNNTARPFVLTTLPISRKATGYKNILRSLLPGSGARIFRWLNHGLLYLHLYL